MAPAPEPTLAPESEFGREAKLAEEPEKVLFKDKNNLILVFEIQKELPSGIRRYLTDLIEVRHLSLLSRSSPLND